MKQGITVLLATYILFGFCCCGGGGDLSSDTEDKRVLPEYLVGSELKKTQGGRNYLEVAGEPFLYTGVQIRTDGYTQLDKRNLAEMEEQFHLAADLGVKCVEVPISWNELEPEQDVYNFKKFRTYLEWCEKYDLKLEVLWFSYDTGQALEMYVPSYIFDDEETYPQYPSDVKGEIWGEQGRITFFRMQTPALLERERKAIGQLTDFIYQWEIENGNPNIVISYQVHNEVDNFPRWNIDNRNVRSFDGGKKLPYEDAWKDIYVSLDSAGKAFKESKYRAVTRVNLVALAKSSDEWKDYAVKIFELDGIDIVGDDTYTDSIEEQVISMNNLSGEEFKFGNLAHVAENSGSFANTSSLILSAITQGAGYLIYCLSMPMFWIRYETNWDWWEQGVTDVDWNDKAHTQRVRDILFGMKKAEVPLACCEISDMKAFNVSSNFPETEKSESFSFGDYELTLSTREGAVGYLLRYDGNIYLFTDKTASVRVSGGVIKAAESGRFEKDCFWGDEDSTFVMTGMDLSGGCLYKLEIL